MCVCLCFCFFLMTSSPFIAIIICYFFVLFLSFFFFWFVFCFQTRFVRVIVFSHLAFPRLIVADIEQAYRLVYYDSICYLFIHPRAHRPFTFFLLFVFILIVFRRFIFQTRRPIIYLAICLSSFSLFTYRRPLWGYIFPSDVFKLFLFFNHPRRPVIFLLSYLVQSIYFFSFLFFI